ncbi:MAG: hypothetical protein EHM80_03435 [Nitrospiraceae bacterium]|nr:MAG: hypothetical protein EHM80_03435 [Nitrospiraceae bacterium]
MWQGIIGVWHGVWWLIGLAKKIKMKGEHRLSPEQAREDRKFLEAVSDDLIAGRGNRWYHRLLRWIGFNDDTGAYLQHLLKSANLEQIRNGASSLEREKIQAKLAAVQARMSGPHQP